MALSLVALFGVSSAPSFSSDGLDVDAPPVWRVVPSPSMSAARRLHYSYDDYLSLLAMSDIKLEYCEGAIYAMAGGTAAHAELAANTITAIKKHLPGCSVFSSDLKVRIEKTDLSTFPDISVISGERRFSPLDANALTNPVILV